MFCLPLCHQGERISNSCSAKCLEFKQTVRFGFLYMGFCLLRERQSFFCFPKENFRNLLGKEREREGGRKRSCSCVCTRPDVQTLHSEHRGQGETGEPHLPFPKSKDLYLTAALNRIQSPPVSASNGICTLSRQSIPDSWPRFFPTSTLNFRFLYTSYLNVSPIGRC